MLTRDRFKWCRLLSPLLPTKTKPVHAFQRYPSRVFVGDTFCYFAGMTFAVAAILGP